MLPLAQAASVGQADDRAGKARMKVDGAELAYACTAKPCDLTKLAVAKAGCLTSAKSTFGKN